MDRAMRLQLTSQITVDGYLTFAGGSFLNRAEIPLKNSRLLRLSWRLIMYNSNFDGK